jgi:hypothetical protein
MSKSKYEVGDRVRYNCIYVNEYVIGEILSIRQANLNWDYSIRYEVFVDFNYVQWVKEQDILEKIK